MKTTRPVLGSAVGGIILLTLLPVPVLIWMSVFNQSYLVIPPRNGYTLDWFLKLPLQNELFGGLVTSLWLAAAASLLATALGLAAAFATRRWFRRRAGAIETFLTLPLTVPHIVLGMALYAFLFSIGQVLGFSLATTPGALLSAHVLITLPWTFRLAAAGVTGLNLDLERASHDLGRGRLYTFFFVSLPLLRPALFSAATLAFIFSFGTLEVSLFLVAPGQTTLPVAMMQYAELKLDPTLAAVAVVQLVITVGMVIMANSLFRLGRAVTGGIKQ